MKSGLFALALALSGCELVADIPSPLAVTDVDANTTDGGDVDAMIDSDGCSGSFLRVCTQPSGTDVTLPAAIDTSTSTLCTVEVDATAGELCVIAARSINLAAGVTLQVTGTRPLVLVAATTVTLDGTLNAKNASGTGCTFTASTGISGGAGGSRGGTGGKGGTGASGAGGVPGAAMPLSLLGGCPGAPSLNSSPPGVGGGSVLVVAATILVAGIVNAAGTGGGGSAVPQAGGAGGGSGGVIILDAPNVTVAGTLLASGGGGGEGGQSTVLGGGAVGHPGATPNPAMPIIAAAGGVGGTGGDGGAGGAILAINGTDGGRSGNIITGGGGGGASGLIKITATAPTITGPVVPAATFP